jgi:TonB family protein
MSHSGQWTAIRPAYIVTASDIPYPVNTATPGIVTLILNLDAAAKVENVQVLRDIPPLTSAAQTAVQTWTFTPATRDGSPVPSTLPVNVVFNPFNPGGVAIEGLAVPLPQPSPAREAAPFTPPQITSGSFAIYSVNSVASGTVVLDVTIGRTGGVAKVKVIRDVPSLTPEAIKAVKAWGFSPATFKGQPIAAHLVVAFVFPSPVLAHPV